MLRPLYNKNNLSQQKILVASVSLFRIQFYPKNVVFATLKQDALAISIIDFFSNVCFSLSDFLTRVNFCLVVCLCLISFFSLQRGSQNTFFRQQKGSPVVSNRVITKQIFILSANYNKKIAATILKGSKGQKLTTL